MFVNCQETIASRTSPSRVILLRFKFLSTIGFRCREAPKSIWAELSNSSTSGDRAIDYRAPLTRGIGSLHSLDTMPRRLGMTRWSGKPPQGRDST